ncbi:MAG: DUF86 domain-containing protein [Chitinivibrionales bacterium]|nr:DUF86 domain-containing protein [Chitinivibrionales bacterium]
MSERPDATLIEDMFQAAERVIGYSQGLSFEEFFQDTKTQDAVVRNIEILGEAAGNVSEKFKAANSAVPWSNIIGMRNRLIHGYFGVNLDVVWSVAQDDLPKLIKMLKTFIK